MRRHPNPFWLFPYVPAILIISLLVVPVAQASNALVDVFGTPRGGGNGQLEWPTGIAVNYTGAGGVGVGDVYVVDSGNPSVVTPGNNRVVEFTADGTFVRAFGYEVVQSGQDNSGGYEVCNAISSPADVCQAGTASNAAGGLDKPSGITIDQNGNVYVVDTNDNEFFSSNRVNVYSATGGFEGAFGWNVNASDPKEELQFCTMATGCKSGTEGSGLGQLGPMIGSISPAVGPNGHLYIPDSNVNLSHRINEFVPTLNGLGEIIGMSFAGAVGWDVIASGPDQASEIQKVMVRAGAGKFTLTFKSSATSELAFDAPAGEAEEIAGGTESVEKALNALPTISSGGGSVAVTGGPGDTSGAAPYIITFNGGPLAGTDVAEITATKIGMSGGSPSTVLSVETYSNGTEGLEYCVVSRGDICQAGGPGPKSGDGHPKLRLGEFTRYTPDNVAVDQSGALYAVNQSGNFEAYGPARVYKFTFPKPGEVVANEFAPEYLTQDSGNPAAVDPLDVTIDPVSQHVLVAKLESTNAVEFYEFDSDGVLLERSPEGESGLKTGGGEGALAIGTSGSFYFANTDLGLVDVFGLPPSPGISVSAVTGVGARSATLHGTVTPPASVEGKGFDTTYHFEYSLEGSEEWSQFPAEDVDVGDGSGSGPPNTCPVSNPPVCTVEQTVTGLVPNSHYVLRLVASTGAVAVSGIEFFTTEQAPPLVSGADVEDLAETSVKLTGFVNPVNEATSYHFEWGTDASYGNRVPVGMDGQAGSGGASVKVTDTLEGLKGGTVYHFRLVATNPSGTTVGPDREFSTLDRYGLPDGRVPEQVSPNDKRPAGMVGQILEGNIAYQASSDGSRIIYPLLNGAMDATAGGNIDYVGAYDGSGWLSSQLTPPTLIPAVATGVGQDATGHVLYASADLSCEIVESIEPLTTDTPAQDVAEGVHNLYLRSADGMYTLLSTPIPLNPGGAGFEVDWASTDCSHVLFESSYRLLEEASGTQTLYEWAEGILKVAGMVPDESAPGGESVAGDAQAGLGSGPLGGFRTRQNSMSSDGSKVFFDAASRSGGDKGSLAVFVRENGASSVDISQSRTAITGQGAYYAGAARDGSHVFFLGRYGLATNGASVGVSQCAVGLGAIGCDLYDYNTVTNTLTDVSADQNPTDAKGAGVVGLLDSSDDGAYVYFAARGQLVANEGKSEAQNLQGSLTYNVYLSHDGELSYVGLIAGNDVERAESGADVTFVSEEWVADATPDGKHLLFVSKADVAGYDSKGVSEAYVYSVASGETVCVSCRPDGQPSVGDGKTEPITINPPLPGGGSLNNVHSRPRAISDDGRRVIFTMPDVLAAGARSRTHNIYEWEAGRVYLLVAGEEAEPDFTRYADMSSSGDDVFVVTKAKLLAQDFDSTTDVYDLRVGGGFAEPGLQVPPCEPLADQCQGEQAPPLFQPPGPASEAFSGPGNYQVVLGACKKGLVLANGKCVSNKPVVKRKKPVVKRCGKGRVRKHGKCVKKTSVSRPSRVATNKGRAGR